MKTLFVVGVAVLLSGCGRGAPVWPPQVIEPPAPVTPICAALEAAPSRVVLAGVTGEYGCVQQLRFVHADGTLSIAGSLGEKRAHPASCIYISDIEVSADGDYILAERLTDGAMLFDRSGVLLVQTESLETMRPVLLARKLWGLLDVANGYQVLGKPIRGRVPVEHYDSGSGHFRGWMNAVDLSVTAISPSVPLGSAEVTFVGDSFGAVVQANGSAQWLKMTPDETTLNPVPDYRGETYVNVKDRRDDWVVIGSYEANRSWRVRTSIGAVELLAPAVPASMTQFRYAASTPGSRLYLDLDDDGGFVDTFRNAYAAGMFHSPDGVRDWTLIGREVTGLQTLYGRGARGTYVVTSSTQVSSGEPIASWAAAPVSVPAPLTGSITQVVRPSTGVSVQLPATAGVMVSQRGVCVSHFTGNADVAVTDMNTGLTQSVAGFNGSRLTWLE